MSAFATMTADRLCGAFALPCLSAAANVRRCPITCSVQKVGATPCARAANDSCQTQNESQVTGRRAKQRAHFRRNLPRGIRSTHERERSMGFANFGTSTNLFQRLAPSQPLPLQRPGWQGAVCSTERRGALPDNHGLKPGCDGKQLTASEQQR